MICNYKNCETTIEDYLTDSGRNPTKCQKHYTQQKERERNRKPRQRNWAQERINQKHKNPEHFKMMCDKKNKATKKNKNSKYLNYKGKAQKAKRSFELSKQFFNILLETQCFYCGRKPGCIDKKNTDNYHSSIDRIDNNKDYTYDNVLPSCNECNMIKKDYDYHMFLKLMEHISIYWKTNFTIVKHPNISRNTKGVWYSQYLKQSKNRGYDFNISKELFYFFRDNSNCYICNKEPSSKHKNGIDRINNNLSYENGNILSCCGMCNIMKKDRNLNDFINHCHNIYNYQKILRNT